MSELRGVVVSHASVSQALVDAVASITGIDDALVPLSNEGCAPGTVQRDILDAVGEEPAVVFVDLPQGSCLISAAHAAKERADIAVVTGVNLAMLLWFVFHRELDAPTAAERAVQAGTAGIVTPDR